MIRILSREKTGLETVSTETALDTLLRHAGLGPMLSADDDEQLGILAVTIQDTAGF